MTQSTRAPFTYTQAGGTLYRVNHSGHIAKERAPYSAQWICTGVVRFNNFGHVVESVPFPRCFMEPRDWRYKNGKGKWFIADIDHGTSRVQMATVLRSFSDPMNGGN